MTITQEVSTKVKDIYLPEPATVLDSRLLTEAEIYLRFKFDDPKPHDYKPGQFYSVTIPGIGEAPISISSSLTRCEENTFEMVVRKVGNVTNALHNLVYGDKVGIRGPFGTTFPVDTAMKGRDLVFICGGIGLVPVRSAIHHVLDNRQDYGDISILVGTRTPADRLFVSECEEWSKRDDVNFLETVDVAIARKPIWTGPVGVITTLLPRLNLDPAKTTTIVCGPPIMYRFVLMELRKLQLPNDQIYLSLERRMKCGVGKCGHCQINGKYACQEGAVFKYSDIESTPEAI
ncbi:MAG: oxidoreductase [Planctomycetes bacterium]|nr:oxidoreductase [Planctomycetota bacterium]MCP4770234.1 oxidoreductase [Planctomycetota bacterium]MCP4860618.1 oxidoreductase [Planctomycetota bacterium]